MVTDRGVHVSTHLSGKGSQMRACAHWQCPVQNAINFLSYCYPVNTMIAPVFSSIFPLWGKQTSLDSGHNVAFKCTCTADMDFYGTLP